MQKNQNAPYKPNYIYWVKHYIDVLWRWKWYIIPTFPTLVIVWFLLVVSFGKIRPVLDVSVLLGLEKNDAVSAFPDAISNNLGQMKLVQSRSFLSEIVNYLSLNLTLPKYDRSSIFSFVQIDSTVIPGRYDFDVDKKNMSTYTISITNKTLNLENKVLMSGRVPSLDTLKTTGMQLKFTQNYLENPFKFTFYIRQTDKAVEDLRKRIAIVGNSRRDPMMDGVVMIKLFGTDAELISTTINTIADKFVEKNVSFRKRKTTELMKALEKQLSMARAQVLNDENQVRIFRENNPKIGLGVDAQSAVTDISMMEAKTIGIQNEIEEAEKLLQRLAQASATDQEQITREALLYLGSQNITSAIILNQEYSTLLQQKTSYIEKKYSTEHPLVKELTGKIDAVKVKTIPHIEEYIKKLNKEIANTKTQQTITINQLQGLPQQEMQLANLMRRQQISSDIYTNIQSKYNQAIISDQTEVSNIYIMDYSVPPEETSAKKELQKLVAIGLFICILIAFGPAVIIDLFDKRVRCEEDLKRFLPFPLLETIPTFDISEKTDVPIDMPNPKLVTASTDLTYIPELFRSLRTKLNYRLEQAYGRSFLITSFEAGEGKSLLSSNIAIMAAQQHAPTLLIDGDMRRGVLNTTFKIGTPPGLSDLLTCENQINEQMLRYTIRQTEFQNLFLLSAGSPIQNPAEALTRTRLKAIINWALTKFRMIIIDAPPLSPVTDAIIMNDLISGTVLVVRAGKSNPTELNKIIEEYPDVKSKILGVILNGVKDNNKRKKYDAYYYQSNPFLKNQPLLLTHNKSDKNKKA